MLKWGEGRRVTCSEPLGNGNRRSTPGHTRQFRDVTRGAAALDAAADDARHDVSRPAFLPASLDRHRRGLRCHRWPLARHQPAPRRQSGHWHWRAVRAAPTFGRACRRPRAASSRACAFVRPRRRERRFRASSVRCGCRNDG